MLGACATHFSYPPLTACPIGATTRSDEAPLNAPPRVLPGLFPEIQDDVRAGRISDAQLETVLYAFMRYNQGRLPDGARKAFFLGDGAGVGKVRASPSPLIDAEQSNFTDLYMP